MIHYHGTPFSDGVTSELALSRRHAIVSFAEPKPLKVAAEICQSFCLDNGAYTAWRTGSPYDPRAYVKWAKLWLRHPGCDFAIAPDTIDGTIKDNKELLRLVDHDSKWCPVWHLHEELSYLRHLSYMWPRVALGSSGEFATIGNEAWWGRIKEAMTVLCDGDGYPKTKIHGLRMLDPVVFSHIPFSSADSTNVARNIGIDSRWNGAYTPASKYQRALILMERIESHAPASRWNPEGAGVQQNFQLLG